jgi:cytochrome P450
LVAVDGEEWANHRKAASSMFSNNSLRSGMESVFVRHAEDLADALKAKAGTGEVVDLQNIFQAFTFDTVSESTTSIQIKSN